MREIPGVKFKVARRNIMEVKIVERKLGLSKDDIVAIIKSYDEENKGKWRTKASTSKFAVVKAYSKSSALSALEKLLPVINEDRATGNITDRDLLNIINCFAINNKVKYDSATFRALKSLLSKAFPDHKNHTAMAAQLIKLTPEKQKIVFKGVGKNPKLDRIKAEFLSSKGVARDNAQPLLDYARKFNANLDAAKDPKGKDAELNSYLDGLKIKADELIASWTSEKDLAKSTAYADQKRKLESDYVNGSATILDLEDFNKTIESGSASKYLLITPKQMTELDKTRIQKAYDKGIEEILVKYMDDTGSHANDFLIKEIRNFEEINGRPAGLNPITRGNLFDRIQPYIEDMLQRFEQEIPLAHPKERTALMEQKVKLEAAIPFLPYQTSKLSPAQQAFVDKVSPKDDQEKSLGFNAK
jgi:hypothetical protein